MFDKELCTPYEMCHPQHDEGFEDKYPSELIASRKTAQLRTTTPRRY